MNKLIILVFFLTLYSSAQKKACLNIIAFETKTEFLNDLKRSFTKSNIKEYKNVSFSNYQVQFVITLPEKLHKIKSSLKIGDFDYFISQINEYEKFENEKVNIDFKLLGYNFIPMYEIKKLGKKHEELWRNFSKKYGKKSLLVLSKPLISKDLQLAIIEIQMISDSDTESKKVLYAFKKINNKWSLLSKI